MTKPTPSTRDALKALQAVAPPSMRECVNELQRLTNEVNDATDKTLGTLIGALQRIALENTLVPASADKMGAIAVRALEQVGAKP